jgi:acetyltransferase-like isoleucine patch superfamily enzyme
MPISDDVLLGDEVNISHRDLVNLYGCEIGSESSIGPFVEIQRGCVVGRRCKIASHSFICTGVVIEDAVMVAHGVMFTNDRFPRATRTDGRPQVSGDWRLDPILVRRGATIGSNATIVAGVTIGRDAFVAAGAVVTRDVPDFAMVRGVPARVVGDVRKHSAAQAAA